MLTPLSYVALLISLLVTLTGCSITHVMRLENREVIGIDTMMGEIRDAPVILVGEQHDAASHHRLQLAVIENLHASGKPVAIGMEMFEASSQQALDAWSAGKVPESAFRKVFKWNWRNVPWGLYQDILRYARANRIPIVALNAPRAIVQKVAQGGYSSLSSEDLRQLPPNLSVEVTDAFLEFMRSSYPAHGRSGEAFRNICEAQLLRNKVMAWQVSVYFAQHRDGTIVVLAGGAHAREEGGIPAELGGLQRRIVLPAVPGRDSDSLSGKDGDYLMQEPFSWLDLLP